MKEKIDGCLLAIGWFILNQLVMSILIMILWNWIAVPLFSVPMIVSLWQAIGLKVLCSCLLSVNVKTS